MLRIALCISIFFFSLHAQAYVRTMSQAGRPIYWSNPNLSLYINPVNSSGLSEANISSILQGAFQSWVNSGANVSFSYSQSSAHNPLSGYDGKNTIYFSSRGNRPLDWGVVAVTEVLYYVNSGQIAETDMVFNDNQFLFTNNPGDTGKYIGGRTAIYLQDVATHEAGHAFGLDHSNVNKSSLIYVAFNGQFNLGEDDTTALKTIYPANSGSGSLRGKIKGLNGGIFGAHIQAINLTTGKVEAGALSDSDGSFRIGDIAPGSYAILMEPFYPDTSSISSYYQNVNHRFCSGNLFRRRFYSNCGVTSAATAMEVIANSSTELGTITPSCTQMGNPGGAPNTINAAKEIQAGAWYGTLLNSESHYYSLNNVSGDLNIHLASYSLYSPVDLRIEILNADGSPVPGATSIDNVENPMPGGLINYDASASANSLAFGTYILKVSSAAQKVPSSRFPAGYDLLDTSGHYLLMVGMNGSFGASTTATDMSSCLSVNNKSQSASFREPASAQETKTIQEGCGSLSPSGGGSGPLSGAISQLFILAILTRLGAAISFRISALVRQRR